MPNLGKKQLPEYLGVSEQFLEQFDEDKYFFKTINNIDENLNNIRNAL